MRRPSRRGGVTLIELVVALGLSASALAALSALLVLAARGSSFSVAVAVGMNP